VSGLAELASPRWHVRDDVESLRDAVQAVDVDERLKKTRNVFDGLKRTVADFLEQVEASPAARPILNALNARDTKVYQNAYADVVRINELAQEYAIRCGIFETFKTSSPATAERYETTACDESWEDRFENFGAAWNWAKTDRWLADLSREDRAKQLADDMKRSQSDERRILKELAVQKAWQHCMHNLGERERQALVAWEDAVKKIGRGTGRNAPRHRETARQKLTECRKAIPAWIMPLYQVVQTTEPRKRFFDVVIVDEASQSGPEAILLNYIGNKIIVIGDDKQIAPENAGVNRDDATRLQQMHLNGIPHPESFDLDSSFFSAARLRFKDQLQLREHFRCMPEIIQFSNKLSYSTQPLYPLRQFGADRLEPCKRTLVNEGYRTGPSSNIENKPEAEKLVEQVVNCLEDPAYDGKTFGVICLLGHAQAKLITNLLMQHVGAEEMERRNLMCGSPGDFQGSERDVIFLSMVDAPQEGKMCRMIRSEKEQRRFNVAASRAKDQLWLFHTPTLNDLKAECLRYRLLKHCLNPSVQPTTVGDHDLAELWHLAKTDRRTDDNHPKPFDSWFEVDVCLKIADRGYRVLPQYEVAGRRIDLVVQGLEGLLAVECDGDRWHGPDRFHKDMERQRQLERCRWTFWRVRGSQFYRDPDAALQSLWEQLTRRGILPECQWSDQRRKNEEGKHSGTKPDAAVEETTVRSHSDSRTVAAHGHPEVAPEDGPQNEEETSEQIYPARSTAHDNERNNQRPENLPPGKIQRAIIEALEECPHGTCTVKSITSRVLKQLGIRTRGNPRAEFERRVKRNVGVLKRKELIEEYKAKNKRLRLLPGAKQATLL